MNGLIRTLKIVSPVGTWTNVRYTEEIQGTVPHSLMTLAVGHSQMTLPIIIYWNKYRQSNKRAYYKEFDTAKNYACLILPP